MQLIVQDAVSFGVTCCCFLQTSALVGGITAVEGRHGQSYSNGWRRLPLYATSTQLYQIVFFLLEAKCCRPEQGGQQEHVSVSVAAEYECTGTNNQEKIGSEICEAWGVRNLAVGLHHILTGVYGCKLS